MKTKQYTSYNSVVNRPRKLVTGVITQKMAMTVRGLDDICRLCAIESESCMPIYSHEGENISLEQKIINCLHIKVSRTDHLPKKVCGTCSSLLEELHQFSCRAANAQQTLSFLFDLQLRQLQEQELGILHSVKLEGNLIKNELDDMTGQHCDPRDDTRHCLQAVMNFSHLEALSEDYQLPCQTPIPTFRGDITGKPKDITTPYSMPNGMTIPISIAALPEENEPKQNHRRKMYQPKKTLERLEKVLEGEPRDKECLVNSNSEEVQCLMNSADTNIRPNSLIDPGGTLNDDSLEVHCVLDSTVQVISDGEVKCLIDSTEHATDDATDVECLMGPEAREDDFQSVDFDDGELFEDLEDEENKVDQPGNRQTNSNYLSLIRDWNIACDKCGEVFPKRPDFETHYRDSHGEKPVYTCSLCCKTMPKFSSFRSHCYRHDSKFPCIYCDKVFTLEGMLRVHVLSKHATERPFICEACGKGYVTQNRLKQHQQEHHSEEKEYRCTLCNKVLQTRNGLRSHMTAHRFGRRFMCHLCGKTFTQKVNMLQHVKYHKGERPFPCDQCNKRFAERSHLNRHKSFHSIERPFQCTVCLKMYKTERCLKVHSQVHQDTRPFVCSECGKGFLSITKLKQHYHCHTGERPYACKYCERTFTNYPNWLKHTRRRHKVDHKTGVKLKEENVMDPSTTLQIHPSESLPEIDYLDMTDIKVKEDGGDAVGLLSCGDSAQSILTDFQVATDLSHFHLPESQLMQYQDHSHMLPL